MSVGTLLGMPAARGLFHKAIPQSGACQGVHADRDGAAAVTAAFLATLGFPAPDARALRDVPAEKLMAAQQQVTLQMVMAGGANLLPFQPVVDGGVLPRHPLDAVREGLSRDVPLLVGTTRDEWKLFAFMDTELRQMDDAKAAQRLAQRLPHADAATIVAGYAASRPGEDAGARWIALESDRVFRIPAIRLLEAQLGVSPDVYAYLYSWPAAAFGGALGACHGIDVAFVFDALHMPGADGFVGTGPEASALAERTVDAWTGFAHRGDPGHPGPEPWPRYDLARRATMEFAARCTRVDDPAGAERRLWDGAL
jgi:para-nitrobenzyl esterase